ncbi:MAG: MFS transporter [Candidatus Gracilibacteria bacterium]
MASSRKATAIIFATVLIDMIGVTIILPSLPIYVEKFSTSTFMISIMYSVFAACAFLAGPIMGSLSDRFGRKPVIVTCLLGTSLSWVVFALSPNLWIIFLSRIIGGFSAGNLSVAQSYLTDISSDEKDRAIKLGLIPTAIGIGFITGPGIGSLLAKISPSIPFWFTGALAFINGIAAIAFLPESIAAKQKDAKIQFNSFTTIWYGLTHKKYKTLILLLLATSMSFESYHSTFILFLNRRFDFSITNAGILLTCIGIMIAINQLVLMKHFWLKYMRPYKIQLIASSALILLFLAATSARLRIFIPIIAILGVMEGTLTVINGSELSGKAEEHERGKIIGISHALIAISQVIAPAMSGFFMDYHINAPWIISSFWMGIVFLILIMHKRELKGTPLDFSGRHELENI